MKRYFNVFSILFLLLNSGNPTFIYGQLSVLGGTTTQSWGYNPTGVSRIGIGNFAISNLNSVLQVDGNTTANATGNVFETNGPSGQSQFWTMNRGGTLVGGLSCNYSNNNLLIDGAYSICVNTNLTTAPRAAAVFHSNGNTGIGNWFYFVPQSQLHIFKPDNVDVFEQITNDATTSSDDLQGFKLGIKIYSENVEIRQQEDAIMQFFTNNAPTGDCLERFRLAHGDALGGTVHNATKVSIPYGAGISAINNYTAILNMGEDGLISNGGRSWMDVGTYMAKTTDHMYVGIKEEGDDLGRAVINWGDNPGDDNYGPDVLKFIFTGANGGSGPAGTQDGLEIAHMNGNGNVGIGDFVTPPNNIEPKRRLEVLDQKDLYNSYPTISLNKPQLRLTYLQDNDENLGIHTDFQTTSLGDLYIHPSHYISGILDESNVGIGTSVPSARLHVVQNASNNLIAFPTGAIVENFDIGAPSIYSGSAYGINLFVNGRNKVNIGLTSTVDNARLNTAGIFIANSIGYAAANTGGSFQAANATSANWAVTAYAPSGNITPSNFGIYSFAPNAPPVYGVGFNVAVYGNAPICLPGITPMPPPNTGSYAGYFNGDLAYTGTFGNPSDSTIKKNIQKFGNSSGILKMINCYTYKYDSTKYGDHINLPKTQQYGLIAQEVELADPSMVMYGNLPPKFDTLGNTIIPAQPIKMVDYTKLTPLLLGGFKEQQTIIDSLIQRVTNLETIVTNCCNASQQNTGNRSDINYNKTNITLTDNLTIILDQNQPNPFRDETDIKYTLPQEIKSASIIFYDRTGRVLNKVDLKDRGQGSIHVYAPDLSSGMYTYSLIADGNLIETKTMVKTR